jgi:SAM-dependent methyltransferase
VFESTAKPCRVLDFGANLGYFSFRIATEFDATVVMIDESEELRDLCITNNLSSTVYLRRHCSASDLDFLGKLEHFDVVLALNVLHHFKAWRRAVDAVLALGDRVVIQTPGADDLLANDSLIARQLVTYLLSLSPTLLEQPRSHTTSGGHRPIFVFEQEKYARASFEMGVKLVTLAHFNCVYPADIEFSEQYRRCCAEGHRDCVLDRVGIVHRVA